MGHIVSLNVSQGGVPKLPIARARLTALGLEGDAQRHLKFHGGPDRALCIYSTEIIDLLNAEGHTLVPGAVGENVTLTGIDLAAIQPGDRLHLGREVVVEITERVTPCKALRRCFKDGDFLRIAPKLRPESARLYARVITPGELAVGDAAGLSSAEAL